ncbi:YqiJ family protein [Cognatishimia activa]|uniref:YqiJ family protein n=1 Tax=Cognatishimia activa TaxID=1715691 RepID=UPI00222E3E66|nr:YqiJ family protein [Cognatishimia activa]UZD90643.1 YqiJ family protein [Cognatishimia activa]
MFDAYLSTPFAPFTFSIALLFGLLALEVIFLFLGGSLFTSDSADTADFAEIDADIGVDSASLDIADLGDWDADLGDVDLGNIEVAEAEVSTDVAGGGIANWLGFGKMPAAIWLATMLASYGLAGLSLQSALQSLFGAAWNPAIVSLPAIFGAIWFTKKFGGAFARLVPKTESESVSERHLGRRKGVVSQGSASRGRPAEVRVTDRHGNQHYLRAEPLRDDATIPQGSEVIVLRHRRDDGYRIVSISESTHS